MSNQMVVASNLMEGEERFAEALFWFIRSFGLHRPDRTPCGVDAGVAEAHALSELTSGPLRQMDLVERLALTKSTVSRLVDGMVSRGWTTRSPAPDDGRGVLLSLTGKGAEDARRLATARAERFKTLLKAIPEDRRSDVLDALTLMEEAARATNPRIAVHAHR